MAERTPISNIAFLPSVSQAAEIARLLRAVFRLTKNLSFFIQYAGNFLAEVIKVIINVMKMTDCIKKT